MHLYLRAAVRFCSLLQVHTSGDKGRTDPEMHALILPCCGSFWQLSASAHTYTCVLRFVFAAFCKCNGVNRLTETPSA